MSNYPQVPKSITNPDVFYKDALDNNAPLDYINFLKLTKYNNKDGNKYYESYISRWNAYKRKASTTSQETIIEQYRDFIKDISLNYTTVEEKKFLSKIDFNDPLDLDIAIPFFVNKISEISEISKKINFRYKITNTRHRY